MDNIQSCSGSSSQHRKSKRSGSPWNEHNVRKKYGQRLGMKKMYEKHPGMELKKYGCVENLDELGIHKSTGSAVQMEGNPDKRYIPKSAVSCGPTVPGRPPGIGSPKRESSPVSDGSLVVNVDNDEWSTRNRQPMKMNIFSRLAAMEQKVQTLKIAVILIVVWCLLLTVYLVIRIVQ